MFKRLTAILITLAMLFGMCAVVTADTTDPYEYLPRNITVACYDGDNSVSVAWINPTKQLTFSNSRSDWSPNAMLLSQK